MAKSVSSLELPLRTRPETVSLTTWLYDELRAAILDGRLKRGARLPSTRDFARQYKVSRGVAMLVMEQLRDEGYLTSRTGSGTWVNEQFPADPLFRASAQPPKPSALPKSTAPWLLTRPFAASDPDVGLFPVHIWSRLTSRQWKHSARTLLASGETAGYPLLRVAIAEYLGSSRGVRCSPDQVIVTTGIQQALDLAARALLRKGDTAWLEDPGYFGARLTILRAGATVIPVPTDADGIDVQQGRKLAPRAKLVYVTPAHQFPLGMTMTLERRKALLRWAKSAKAVIVEDDYDSEFRFSGRPIPALQGLDEHGSVLFIGSFNKVLFPGLRLGYMVVPDRLVDQLRQIRFESDFWPNTINQAVLADFIAEGHLGRHIRRAREHYAERLTAMKEAGRKYLGDSLRFPEIQAGLATSAFYDANIGSIELEELAAANGITIHALQRWTLRKISLHGMLMGFAAFQPKEIASGMQKLAEILDQVRQRESRARA